VLKWRWGWIAIILTILLLGGYLVILTANGHRRILAATMFPKGSEVAKGTDIVLERTAAGSVGRLGIPRWGLDAAVRFHDGLELWHAITVFDRSVTRGGRGAAVAIAILRSADEVIMTVEQGTIQLRFRRSEGTWIDSTSPSRKTVRINGKAVKLVGGALRLLPGDYIGLDGVDLRVGRFLKFTAAELTFTTTKLCPLTGFAKWLPWRPNLADQQHCAAWTVRGASQLGLTESFGLTKPVLKLDTSDSVAAVIPADTLSIALAPRTDLMAELEQMAAYLNAPAASRPEPITHFEVSVAYADSMVRSITGAARRIGQTAGTINTAFRSPDGLAPALLGAGSNEGLRQTLSNTAELTGRLADPTGTLVQNIGLDPVVGRATRSLDQADTTMELVRAELLRVAPRVELAADRVTSSMEGVEGTLQSVKNAAQDVSGATNSLKSGKTKGVALGALGLVAVAALVSLAAHLKYIF
jgi:hypothetical protein